MNRTGTGFVGWIFLALWLFFATQVDIDPDTRAKNDRMIALSPGPIKAIR